MYKKIATFTLVSGLSLLTLVATPKSAEASYRNFIRENLFQQQTSTNQTPYNLDGFWTSRRSIILSVPQGSQQPTTQQPTQSTEQPTERTNHIVAQREIQMLNWVNEERAKVGLAPLKLDLELSRWARLKSQDMKDKGYFAHYSPTYGTPGEMVRNAGIQYLRLGENISSSQSPYISHLRLMASDGHRRNILNPNFTHIGIGIVDSTPSGVLVTQLFIQR
ncbi:uncharacterized protein, YkwD family [Anaerobranca californiensis DSM 14826]|jgi:uncharacterized YkwD family protein|uniref:Uncharacterized protein, YkwD family n=1 Tax=Anaerobranca californiensis DSM 14826 TaxID=1120989 RepID=A0A1M6S5H5_9FIRM|nr:CAP domain-containing protein [Anaerobranca californiensis]SHK39930.1 uncharacterized protein, YkwD family [Anaerobranca californiensis DSM 14826]